MKLAEGLPLTVFDSVYHVGPLLGQGSEGAVYAVCDEDAAPRFALKWYHADKSFPGRHASLLTLTDQGPPSDLFLWPLAVIASDDGAQFGYVMDLRPPDFVGMAKLLSGELARSERSLARGALDLAEALYALHLKGLCFNDLSFGNVFVKPDDGSVRLCDNDNVRVDGVQTAFVAGTPKFMAPEVVRGEARASASTDRFSLAVLLFYLFMVGHPLEGRRTEGVLADDDAHRRFHGAEPIFCFDPADDRNRPDEHYHAHVVDLWRSLPAFVQELFNRSFTDGLVEPLSRVRDSEWVGVLRRLLDSSTLCPSCDEERYLDLGAPSGCPWCGFSPPEQAVLSVGSAPPVSIACAPGAEVRGYHFAARVGDRTAVAVVRSGSDAQHLTNVSETDWTAHDGSSTSVKVPPGGHVALIPNAVVETDLGPIRMQQIRFPVSRS